MLIPCLAEVNCNDGNTRAIGLYGQEFINIMAIIVSMNLVLHRVSAFDIRSGKALFGPALIEDNLLKNFDGAECPAT